MFKLMHDNLSSKQALCKLKLFSKNIFNIIKRNRYKSKRVKLQV